MAVYTLPPEMLKFYKANIDYLTSHAVDPDKRRYVIKEEASYHFIDADHYDVLPFNKIPRKWNDAVDKYSEDTLMAHGIVPWHIQIELFRLTEAFRNKDAAKIIKLSADLGHYVADANVPLHTTGNYNGQFTNQNGIHGFWESRLPELFGEKYNYFVGRANYIEKPLDETWKIIIESHTALDSVLRFEKELTQKFTPDRKYSFEKRNGKIVKVYSLEFSTAYHVLLKGQVEQRMRASIYRVGSFWLTAWINAGQPDLNPLIKTKVKKEKVKSPQEKIILKDRETDEIKNEKSG